MNQNRKTRVKNDRLETLRQSGPNGYLFFTLFGGVLTFMGITILSTSIIHPVKMLMLDPSQRYDGYEDVPTNVIILLTSILLLLSVGMLIGGITILWKTLPVTIKVLRGKESVEELLKDGKKQEDTESVGDQVQEVEQNVILIDNNKSWRFYPKTMTLLIVFTHAFLIIGITDLIRGGDETRMMILWTGFSAFASIIVWAKYLVNRSVLQILKSINLTANRQPVACGQILNLDLKISRPVQYKELALDLVIRSRRYTKNPKEPPHSFSSNDLMKEPVGSSEEIQDHGVFPIASAEGNNSASAATVHLHERIELPGSSPVTGTQGDITWEWLVRLRVTKAGLNNSSNKDNIELFFPLDVYQRAVSMHPEEIQAEQPFPVKEEGEPGPEEKSEHEEEFVFLEANTSEKPLKGFIVDSLKKMAIASIKLGGILGTFVGVTRRSSDEGSFWDHFLSGALFGVAIGSWLGFVTSMIERKKRKIRDDIIVGVISSVGWAYGISLLWKLVVNGTFQSEGLTALVPSFGLMYLTAAGGLFMALASKKKQEKS